MAARHPCQTSNHACMQVGGIVRAHYPARFGTLLLLNPPPCFPILHKAPFLLHMLSPCRALALAIPSTALCTVGAC